ncbi:MAG TPA: histidine phosphatase family protein [Myxococcales bacterium]|nr:histidine phosphatase family protein [Myxococcales bacterium]
MNSRATLYLCRHGDTAWSGERRFAGRTDIPLTPEGEKAAVLLGKRLAALHFDRVLVSPLGRARRTADLAGFPDAVVEPRLIELYFGQYEGKTRAEIVATRPGWTYVRDGNPGGEGVAEIAARIDPLLADLPASGNVLIFAHAVVLRVLAARWVGLPETFAQHLSLSPASLSILHYDTVDDANAIAVWNDRSHLPDAGSFA